MALRTPARPGVTSHPVAIVIGMENAIGLTVARELGEHGVPVHGVARSSTSIGLASRYCRDWSLRPADDPADWLPDLVARTGAKAVFAISETDLLALSQLPPMIGDCHILTPRSEQLAQVLNKSRTLAVAEQAGLLAPQTWQPVVGEDFAERAAGMRFPLVAKWANPPEIMAALEAAGLDWFKTAYIHTPRELMALLDRYAPIGRWPLIQQYCEGVGVGQMLYMADGKATLRFQHRRLHEWPPEGGVSSSCRAEPAASHQAQMALSEKLLRALDWQGPAMVEYRYDEAANQYWLMEVNGRFWGSLPLARHCRAHFAWEAYRRSVLQDERPAQPTGEGLHARYMVPETKRLVRLLLGADRIADPFFKPTPMRDLLDYMLGFFDPKGRYYVFSFADPRPFFSDAWQMLKKSVRRGNP